MTKLHFNEKSEQATKYIELINSNVCGSITVKALGEFNCFITFIDTESISICT